MRLRLVLLAVLAAACRPSVVVDGRVEVTGGDAAGVLVQLVSGAGGETVSTITGEDGHFSLEAGPGARTLVASAEWAQPRQVTVPVSEASAPLVLRFTAVGTLAGKALLGGRPEGNAGLPVRVPGLEDATTMAADDGAFQLEVPVGRHRVEAVAPGHVAALSDEVEVRRGETTTVDPLILRLVGFGQTGALVGQVTRLDGRSEGVEVLLEGAGLTTTTVDGGVFSFPQVPEGSYTLQLRYGGLVERVPRVLVTRGADGFVVDKGLYRLADHPIPLMEATRLDGDEVKLGRGMGPRTAWWALTETGWVVRWADTRSGRVDEAGPLTSRTGVDLPLPQVSRDGSQVLWASSDGVFATPVDGGVRRQLGSGFRGAVTARGLNESPAGQVVFLGYPPGLNEEALQVVSIHDGGVQVIRGIRAVYEAAFVDEALVWVSDPRDYRGPLSWWRDGERREVGTVEVPLPLSRRFTLSRNFGGNTSTLLDLATGQTVLSHQGIGLLSADGGWYGFGDMSGLTLRALNTGDTTRLSSRAGWVPACVDEGRAVAMTQQGVVWALAAGSEVELGEGRVLTCTASHVYLLVGSMRGEERLQRVALTGGPPVPLATQIRGPLFWAVRVDEAHERVWLVTDVYHVSNVGSFGTLWTASTSGGPAVKVADDVEANVLLRPSPGGKRAAVRTTTGLAVVEADGTRFRRVSTSVSEVAWVDDETLVFTMAPQAAPRRFQTGLYVARVQ